MTRRMTVRERWEMRREARQEMRTLTTPPKPAAGPQEPSGAVVRRLRARLALRRQIVRALRDPLVPVVVGTLVVVGVTLVLAGVLLALALQKRED